MAFGRRGRVWTLRSGLLSTRRRRLYHGDKAAFSSTMVFFYGSQLSRYGLKDRPSSKPRIMLLRTISPALLGLWATAWAAPTLHHANHIRSEAPPGCIGWVWDLVQICILSPPTSTIGPSTRRDKEALVKRDIGISYPRTVTDKRDEPEPPANQDGTAPTPTSPVDCIPLILDEFNICISPPTTTIIPSTKMKRDWFGLGPPTVGGIVPDKTIPGGSLVPDNYVPGGALRPDVTVPGGQISPST